jgi:hypothetical protein
MRSAYPTNRPRSGEDHHQIRTAFNAIPADDHRHNRAGHDDVLEGLLITFFSNKPTKVPAITARQFT